MCLLSRPKTPPVPPPPPPPPPPPTRDDVSMNPTSDQRKPRRGRQQTVFTSPLGVQGQKSILS